MALCPRKPKRIWPSSADGNWRDKVILSEAFTDARTANAADVEPEAEL
jgi:hypothetical protein